MEKYAYLNDLVYESEMRDEDVIVIGKHVIVDDKSRYMAKSVRAGALKKEMVDLMLEEADMPSYVQAVESLVVRAEDAAAKAEDHETATNNNVEQSNDAAARAQEFMQEGGRLKDQTEALRDDASESALEAGQSAETALQHKNTTATLERQAGEHDSAAQTAKNTAIEKANVATSKATEATQKASQAETFKNQAGGYKDQSAAHEEKAKQYATRAENAAAALTGAMLEAGGWDASTGSYPPPLEDANGAYRSCFWKVTKGGTLGNVPYTTGDSLVYSATLDTYYKIDNTETLSKDQAEALFMALGSAPTWNDVGLRADSALKATGDTLSGAATNLDVNLIEANGGIYERMIEEANCPNSARCGTGYHYLMQFAYGSTTNVTQIAIPYATSSSNVGRIAMRGSYGGTWKAWSYLYNTHNKPTPEELGAMPDQEGLTPSKAIDLGQTHLDTLKDYHDAGFYHQNTNADAEAAGGYPVALAGSLLVQKSASGTTQTYTVYNNGRVYTRAYYAGSWSAWRMSFDTVDKPTPSGIGALGNSGNQELNGTLTMPLASDNAPPETDKGKFSGHGAIFNRAVAYFHNGLASGKIALGLGGNVGGNIKLAIEAARCLIYDNLEVMKNVAVRGSDIALSPTSGHANINMSTAANKSCTIRMREDANKHGAFMQYQGEGDNGFVFGTYFDGNPTSAILIPRGSPDVHLQRNVLVTGGIVNLGNKTYLQADNASKGNPLGIYSLTHKKGGWFGARNTSYFHMETDASEGFYSYSKFHFAQDIYLYKDRWLMVNGRKAIRAIDSSWLRINDSAHFASGVLFGSSAVRTDNYMTVGGYTADNKTLAVKLQRPNGGKWNSDKTGAVEVGGLSNSDAASYMLQAFNNAGTRVFAIETHHQTGFTNIRLGTGTVSLSSDGSITERGRKVGHTYSGTGAPSNSTGHDGDTYIQY